MAEEAVKSWNVHSARSTLTSGPAAVGLVKPRRDYLGRRAPEGADTYTRTFRTVVASLQAQFAEVGKSGRGFERFDAGGIGVDLVVWLTKRRGMPAPEAVALSDRTLGALKAGAEHLLQVAPRDRSRDGAPRDEAQSVPPAPPSSEEESLAEDVSHVLVYGPKRKSARLHRAGGCAWVTVRQPRDSVCMNEVNPSEYDSVCRVCWPPSIPAAQGSSCSEGSDSSTSGEVPGTGGGTQGT